MRLTDASLCPVSAPPTADPLTPIRYSFRVPSLDAGRLCGAAGFRLAARGSDGKEIGSRPGMFSAGFIPSRTTAKQRPKQNTENRRRKRGFGSSHRAFDAAEGTPRLSRFVCFRQPLGSRNPHRPTRTAQAHSTRDTSAGYPMQSAIRCNAMQSHATRSAIKPRHAASRDPSADVG